MTFNKETIKRYVISSLITFVTGFAMVLVAQIDSLKMESFTDGTIIGVLFVAIRMGVKGVLELLLATFANK